MSLWESNGFKYLKNLWIGVGAGLIIIGALWKIMHWQYANEILTFAMLFEATIFFLQAIIPPEKDYKWERVYPQLERKIFNKMGGKKAAIAASAPSLTDKLDDALRKGDMDESGIENLGQHLKSLSHNINNLTTVTNSASATEEYASQAKEAARALGRVKEAYAKAAVIGEDLTLASDDTKRYHEQMQMITKNLANLNAVYELELQDTNNHLKAINKFYTNLTSAVDHLNDSVEDTKLYKTQLATLNKNLSSLNTIHGNMLGAMATARG